MPWSSRTTRWLTATMSTALLALGPAVAVGTQEVPPKGGGFPEGRRLQDDELPIKKDCSELYGLCESVSEAVLDCFELLGSHPDCYELQESEIQLCDLWYEECPAI